MSRGSEVAGNSRRVNSHCSMCTDGRYRRQRRRHREDPVQRIPSRSRHRGCKSHNPSRTAMSRCPLDNSPRGRRRSRRLCHRYNDTRRCGRCAAGGRRGLSTQSRRRDSRTPHRTLALDRGRGSTSLRCWRCCHQDTDPDGRRRVRRDCGRFPWLRPRRQGTRRCPGPNPRQGSLEYYRGHVVRVGGRRAGGHHRPWSR